MSNRVKIAQEELRTVNELQSYMSTLPSNLEDSDAIVDAMLSDEGFHFLSRFNVFRHKMASEPTTDAYKFNLLPNADQLNLSTFCQKLPRISLQQKYTENHRIAWIPKTLLHIIEKAHMYDGDYEIGVPLTGRIIDIWVEYHSNEFFKTDYETILDRIQGDTQWNTSLEEKLLSLPQPFFYAMARSYFKQCLLGNKKISHHYHCRLDIRDLLIMEKRNEEGIWERCSKSEITEKCEGAITTDGILISQPELWGTYLITNEHEQKDLQMVAETRKHFSHTQELVYINSDRVLEGNGTEIIRLEQSGCVRGIYWVIENLNATERGEHFNYATEEKRSPVIETSLYHLDKEAWRIDSHHHRFLYPAEALLRTPRQTGYHYHPFCINGSLKNTDTNINLLALQSRLHVKYDMGPRTRGRLHIFLDMHRVICYENKEITILRDESPGPLAKPTPQVHHNPHPNPPMQQQPRSAVVMPTRR